MTQFSEIKNEILHRAKDADACVKEYKRALKAQSLEELARVIKDNFTWCCNNKLLDADMINQYKTEFSSVDIYANESISSGYVFIDSDVNELSGDAIAFMCGTSTVAKMYENSIVLEMRDNSKVDEMRDNSRVLEMRDNSTVTEMCENSSVNRMYDNSTIAEMRDYSIVAKMWNNSRVVKMWGNARAVTL